MEWIDKELGNFWWADATTHISAKQKYKLFIDIISDWKNIAKLLHKAHEARFHSIYTGSIIHDGNRSCGALESYVDDYEKGGTLLNENGWHTAQIMLSYIRQGEILTSLFESKNK